MAPEPETTCPQVSFDLEKHITRFTLIINLINTISQRPCLDILVCENYFLLLLTIELNENMEPNTVIFKTVTKEKYHYTPWCSRDNEHSFFLLKHKLGHNKNKLSSVNYNILM